MLSVIKYSYTPLLLVLGPLNVLGVCFGGYNLFIDELTQRVTDVWCWFVCWFVFVLF